MKRMIPVLIAIVLIIVIGVSYFGKTIVSKYSYSNEKANLEEYFGVKSDSEVPVLLQDEQIEEYAKIANGVCYFDMDTVHKYFNDRFYEDKEEKLVLYALPDKVIRTEIGSSSYLLGDQAVSKDHELTKYEGDTLYLALDFVSEYTQMSYELFDNPKRLQIYNQWEEKRVAEIDKATQVRYQGGIKSPILTEVESGDKVTILEEMETWSKVKTKDSFIGYVENKKLTNIKYEEPIPSANYTEPVYGMNTRDHKINMAWHRIYSVAGNDTLTSDLAITKSVNVISPTWYSLSDEEGNFTSFASKDYTEKAHSMGLEVWAMVDNLNNGTFDLYAILGNTTTRTYLINGLIDAALTSGVDGLNIDFENVSVNDGQAFIQFIRELSIRCRENNLVLSVDNYVPLSINDHYERKEQGVVADYVVIMGYDEHYRGGGEAGPVASINYVENGIAKTAEQVQANKIINAVPFFNRIWETEGTEIGDQAVGMEMAREFITNHNLEMRWDEETCHNYGEFQSGSKFYQLWLEDAESIKVKLNVMSNYGIGGVAEWSLGYETADVWDVIEAYMNQQ